MALRAVAEHGPVELVDAGDLPERAQVMTCALIGAPSVVGERPLGGDDGLVLREAVQDARGDQVAAVMCLEAAGANGLLPVAWAARMGLPLVDADGAGRAFPRLRQHSLHLAGVPACPVVLTDGAGTTVVVREMDEEASDRLVQRTAAALGGMCAASLYCLSAGDVPRATVAGSVTRALALGAAAAAQPSGVADALGVTVLLAGEVVAVPRPAGQEGRAADGVPSSSVTVRGLGAQRGRQMRVEMQDHFLVALEDGVVRAAVPDVIALLSTETGLPIATEEVHVGERVAIVAIPGAALWQTDAGRELTGPSAFGYVVGGDLDGTR
jgi:DUF917 family protein